MIYLSKGILVHGPKKNRLLVRHFGLPTEITGVDIDVWLNGRRGFAYTQTKEEDAALERLVNRHLANCELTRGGLSEYKILRKCLICPSKGVHLGIPPLSRTERTVLTWLKKAGIHLSLAELISLFDKGVEPTADLLYRENTRKLMNIIHPSRITIAYELENRMMHSIARKSIVDAVMRLLYRNRVFLM